MYKPSSSISAMLAVLLTFSSLATVVPSLKLPLLSVFPVRASTGNIHINSTTAPSPTVTISIGENVSLYFGDVTWSGGLVDLYLSLDGYGSLTIPGDLVYGPTFSVADIMAPAIDTTTYLGYTVGHEWINGTCGYGGIPGGDYYVKAYDGTPAAVAVTDNYIRVEAGIPPDLTVFEPQVVGLTVTVNGVVLPGTPSTTITRIHWDWGDGDSEDHWFPATHTYANYGKYTITVTACQSDGLNSTRTKQVSIDYPTIQAAIDAASPGDTIHVAAGTYYENVVVNKPLTLVGENRTTTIIDGSGTGNVILVTADDVSISGFTIQNGGELYPNAGIFLDSVAGCGISDNNVSHNLGHGVFLMWANNNNVSNNIVTFNGKPGIRIDVSKNNLIGNHLGNNDGDGVLLYAAFDCLIEDNFVHNNTDAGISIMGGSTNITVKNNKIENNGRNGIFHLLSLACSTEGNTISNNEGSGIFIDSSNNSIISHNTITSNNDEGISLHWSSNNTISGNNVANNGAGIGLHWSSNNNTISGNDMTANNNDGVDILSSSNDSLTGNNITKNSRNGIMLDSSSNNPISENTVTNNFHGVYLFYSSNNTVSGNNITNNGFGILLHYSSNKNTVSGNNITSNGFGIGLFEASDNNTISGNDMTANNGFGIGLFQSSNKNTFSGNNVANNGFGIELVVSSDNTFSGNNITSNGFGILLYISSDNTFSGNNITSNGFGIGLYESSNNSICHNNFVDNGEQVDSDVSTNFWDDGYPSGGNYWSDHATVDDYSGVNQDEPGSDGIVDVLYTIDDYNRDNYPLVKPWAPRPPSPQEALEELINAIESWNLDTGIESSLTSKLEAAYRSLERESQKASIGQLTAFMNEVRALREKKLTSAQADYLISEAQKIIDLIEG